MNFKKTLIVSAVSAAMGGGALTAQAAAITSITLGDADGDGVISGFRFATGTDPSFPTGVPGTYPGNLTFGPTGELCGGGFQPGTGGTGSACLPITAGASVPVGPSSFTTGFNFGGGGFFGPTIADDLTTPVAGGGGVVGDVTASTLSFTVLDFAGQYNGGTFLLAPESRNENANTKPWAFATSLTSAVTDPAFHNFTAGTNLPFQLIYLTDNSDGTYDFAINFTSRISSSNGDAGSNSFDGQVARWRLEGCASTTGTACVISAASAVPVPAAVWLFGSGLLGLVGVARRKRQSV